jgi:prepilin-type processing-associated H-X9-DG protein
MKPKLATARRAETSFLDVIAILAAVFVVAMVVLPMLAKSRAKPSRINCVNNIKQVGLSFRLWSGDNNDKYPMQVSTNEGGTMELVSAGAVFPHFMVMSNELSTPKILCCPTEYEKSGRKFAYDFTNLTDNNISYFVAPEADEMLPEMWLCGDRNLATNNTALKPGLFTLTTNSAMQWTSGMHSNHGNICFADGSAQQYANAKLQASATNALRAYFEATTNTTFRIAIP